MATLRLFRPSLRPFSLTFATATTTSLIAAPLLIQSWRRPMLMDSLSEPTTRSYQRDAKTPIVRNGRFNEKALRQVSAGSILGLIGGVVVSIFSKPLALLIGLLVIGVQALESRGIHLVPYNRIQRYFSNVSVKTAVQDNVAFKLSFGTTFALAAFAHF